MSGGPFLVKMWFATSGAVGTSHPGIKGLLPRELAGVIKMVLEAAPQRTARVKCVRLRRSEIFCIHARCYFRIVYFHTL
jgi:hypothetical protein